MLWVTFEYSFCNVQWQHITKKGFTVDWLTKTKKTYIVTPIWLQYTTASRNTIFSLFCQFEVVLCGNLNQSVCFSKFYTEWLYFRLQSGYMLDVQLDITGKYINTETELIENIDANRPRQRVLVAIVRTNYVSWCFVMIWGEHVFFLLVDCNLICSN